MRAALLEGPRFLLSLCFRRDLGAVATCLLLAWAAAVVR